MTSQRALLVEFSPERKLGRALQDILDPHFNLSVVNEYLPENALCSFQDEIRSFDPLVIFLILSPRLSDNRPLQSIKEAALRVPIIAVLEDSEPERVFELLKGGAADFIIPPLNASDVLPRTWKLLGSDSDNGKPTPFLGTGSVTHQLVGESPDFVTLLHKIPQIARCDANVLIEGETGTGKEVYARAIHYHSTRASKPFVPVNCGAIPVELVENELFGHERGAFTSAFTLQAGLIEEANGGTLFLDEIDCLPPMAQVKLLRFLQEKEYKPLGSTKLKRADVRIVAASNLDLEKAIQNGKMRQDLFYRLNVISLTLPPLRERRDDILLLARYFAARYAAEFNKELSGIAPDALHVLMAYNWPGNVRQLQHVIERATVMAESTQLTRKDLDIPIAPDCESLREAKAKEIAKFEKNYIQGLLSVCNGNITRAAEVAQKNRRALWQLIQKHRIDVSRFKPSLPR
ncbi:MAG TPA: sigma-54 dependent transcriptional regulator [Pyrinomonadaceae bacterium]|jgi:DNA-binding NtrC family response regulator|nr:sigma-54 dependent transcriptional regulator [Pyrinomonadaceae bacterium]